MHMHWVKNIQLNEVKPVNDAFVRTITVQSENGEKLELVLFSNNAEDLWVKP